MSSPKASTSFVVLLVLVNAGSALAADISGKITSTLTIYNDSKLVGDVTCQVTGAPCIVILNPFALVASSTLDLNGFTISGRNDVLTGCSAGGASGSEVGISVVGQSDVVIQGPGIVRNFPGHGIVLSGTRNSTVTGVTTATNCFAGIFVTGGSSHNVFERNVSVRNGNVSNPCGGI